MPQTLRRIDHVHVNLAAAFDEQLNALDVLVSYAVGQSRETVFIANVNRTAVFEKSFQGLIVVPRRSGVQWTLKFHSKTLTNHQASTDLNRTT